MKYLIAGILAAATCLLPAFSIAQEPFRIGLLNDQSSVFSSGSGKGSHIAIEMAIQDFGGKVLGRPIEFLSADHQNKVDVATGIAREWLAAKNVQAIFDLQNSSVALAVIPLVEKANKIAIISSSGSSDITGKFCTPNSFHWTYDTYAVAQIIPRSIVKQGKKSWFFITSDYSFGNAMERDIIQSLAAQGGSVAGTVKVPVGATNFSSALLAAQNSQADTVLLGGGSADMVNQLKQAKEFGMGDQQLLVSSIANVVDVHGLGLEVAQGLYLTESFYWDLNDETRAWSKRFIEKFGIPANMNQAGLYSAALHYLRSVEAAGTSDGLEVGKAMIERPINDMMTKDGKARRDGRLLRNMYLFRVKSPAASKGKFDYLELVSTHSGEEVFRPLSESACPLVKQ